MDDRRQHEVLRDGQAGVDAAVVGHPAEAARGRGRRGRALVSVGAVERDRALGLPVQAHDGAQQRGLAGAVAPDQGDDLAVADVEGDVAQRLRLAVPGGEPPDLEAVASASAMVRRHPSVPEVGRDDPLVGAHLLVGALGEHLHRTAAR